MDLRAFYLTYILITNYKTSPFNIQLLTDDFERNSNVVTLIPEEECLRVQSDYFSLFYFKSWMKIDYCFVPNSSIMLSLRSGAAVGILYNIQHRHITLLFIFRTSIHLSSKCRSKGIHKVPLD